MNQTITINEELSLSWPEGFAEMTDKEIQQAFRGDNSKAWGLWDKEKHRIIFVLWKKYSALAIKMTSPKKMLEKNEKMTSQVCKNANYHREFFFTSMVGDQIAGGYCYTYQVDQVRQAVKTVLLQRKHYIYSISCYSRVENSVEDFDLFDEILRTVSFKDI